MSAKEIACMRQWVRSECQPRRCCTAAPVPASVLAVLCFRSCLRERRHSMPTATRRRHVTWRSSLPRRCCSILRTCLPTPPVAPPHQNVSTGANGKGVELEGGVGVGVCYSNLLSVLLMDSLLILITRACMHAHTCTHHEKYTQTYANAHAYTHT